MGSEIVDACCIINVYAAGELGPFLSVIGGNWHVPKIVISEALYVVRTDREDQQESALEEIDLSPAIRAGYLHICDLESDEENGLFLEFASEVDDGEAACLAIAKARGWSLATDDRKAQRLARESGIAVVTTPELIKRWADKSKASDEELSVVLQRIRDSARFIPRSGSALYRWWIEKLEGR